MERNDNEKMDEAMLPGFRFHPTDEELVGFYLRRKIQQKPLSVELIKQLDIYKYDPWDLPKMATTGEKEWYFYCPRDRKYRNSARPNRVTGAGFWKATGTDRPIYSSEGSKCIGLKKSLVFYRGKAAKGIKTDWMMHEFRLPSVSNSVAPNKYLDTDIPAYEAWAICKIFMKANPSAQRALAHSWVCPEFDSTNALDMISLPAVDNVQFSSSNFTKENGMSSSLKLDFRNDTDLSSIASFTPLRFPSGKPFYQRENTPCQVSEPATKFGDVPASLLTDMPMPMPTSIFGDFLKGCSELDCITFQDHQRNGFSATVTDNMPGILPQGEQAALVRDQSVEELFDDQWGPMRSMGNPYGFPLSLPDAWKSNFLWDSSPCPSELSTNYSTNK